jgi:tetratricopeptide (TPR) repeat protein
MKSFKLLAAAVTAMIVAGCSIMAVMTAPAKVATVQRSPQAIQADQLFWQTLHGGNYAGIDGALQAETAAYLADPDDAVTASHIGWLHIWRISERARLTRVPATITDDMVVARRYFQEAHDLDPAEARVLGFLASTELAEGRINQTEKLTRQGYYHLRDAIDAWPEFNLFTAGYVMSNQPADSPRFREALQWQWDTLDACVNARIDHANPDFGPYMGQSTTTGRKRACWNSAIAPHNLEGFFFNMGDLLVKAGDWQTARKIYANARLAPEYASWPYAAALDQRIVDAESNVKAFNSTSNEEREQHPMMFNSEFSCMACHRR